jgi:hypothetical protein
MCIFSFTTKTVEYLSLENQFLCIYWSDHRFKTLVDHSKGEVTTGAAPV